MIPDPVFVVGVAGAFVALVGVLARRIGGRGARRVERLPLAVCPLCGLRGCSHWRSYLEAIRPELRP